MTIRIKHTVKRDIDLIRQEVEKEFKLPLKIKIRDRCHVDVKRVFIALVLFVYNDIRDKLGSRKVTLTTLSNYLGYKSHASISLHLVNSHKGDIGLQEYIMGTKGLRESYLRLKSKIEKGNSPTFVKFLSVKKEELEEELNIINTYLNKHCEEKEEEIIKSSS